MEKNEFIDVHLTEIKKENLNRTIAHIKDPRHIKSVYKAIELIKPKASEVFLRFSEGSVTLLVHDEKTRIEVVLDKVEANTNFECSLCVFSLSFFDAIKSLKGSTKIYFSDIDELAFSFGRHVYRVECYIKEYPEIKVK